MPRQVRLPSWPWARLGLRAGLVLSLLVIVLPAFLLLLAADCRQGSSQRDAAVAESGLAAEAARALLVAGVDEAAAALRLAVDPAPSAADAPEALQRVLAGRPGYLAAFLLDGDGDLVAYSPADRPLVLDGGLVAQALTAAGPVVSELMTTPPDERTLFEVLVPVRWADGRSGAAGVAIDAAALGAWLRPLVRSGALHVTLCDQRGWSVYSTLQPDAPLAERDWSGYAQIQQALAGQEALAAEAVSHVDGRAYVGVALPVPEVGWVVAAQRPAPGALSYLGRRLAVTLPALAAMGAAAFLLATWMARRYTEPLLHLARHARALGRGQLNERIALNRRDEFGALAQALNDMAQELEERDRRLQARLAELEALISQAADGIGVHGPQGELLLLNPAGVRILGRSPGRLGLSLAEQASWFRLTAASGRQLEPGELAVAAALRGETRLAQEVCATTEAGEVRHVAVSASPLSDPRGHIYGAVSTWRDTTQAHQAQKEKDDFISLVSHELKTPITSIKGYAQMLWRRAEEAGGDERDLKGLRIINEEVDRMVDLINQLLDVSRLEAHRLQLNMDVVDLVALTHDAVDRLQATTGRHALRLRAPQEPMWVEGDAMRLAQVLGNLLTNAIKYSPAGGPVEITLESREGRGWVSVRDWGVGIAPEDQPNVFQRFYRGTRRGPAAMGGMGLGLYISREIVQRHRGDVAFHSQPGQGSTFLFWLPLAGSERSGRPAAGQTHPPHGAWASEGRRGLPAT